MDKFSILQATGLTHDEHTDLMLDNAKRYLQHMTANDMDAVDQIRQNPLFWNWWVLQWRNGDMEFESELQRLGFYAANKLTKAHVQPEVLLMYKIIHHGEYLHLEGIKPHKILEKQLYKEATKGKEVKHG